jgi:hypothetical protein
MKRSAARCLISKPGRQALDGAGLALLILAVAVKDTTETWQSGQRVPQPLLTHRAKGVLVTTKA